MPSSKKRLMFIIQKVLEACTVTEQTELLHNLIKPNVSLTLLFKFS